MNKSNCRKWFFTCLGTVSGGLLLVFMLVFVFDPYFHFHKPFSFVRYRLYDERYTNDGISRHFDFNAMVTGTSMAQNFKPSEIDDLYGVKSVKETFSGSGLKEQSENLDRALKRNKELKTVFWSLDYNILMRDKDWTQYEGYPIYLYDDNSWNDISYVFNKSILYHGVLTNLLMTIKGEESTTLDQYSSWEKPTGEKYVKASYIRPKEVNPMAPHLEDFEYKWVTETIDQNVVNLVKKYPDTTFYIFYTPYSIYYWDCRLRDGLMLAQFEAEEIATQKLLECDNVKLYNFFHHYDVVCNADNYRDKEHYSAEINSQILKWMLTDDDLITKENYKERLEEEKAFYINYDYDSLFQ